MVNRTALLQAAVFVIVFKVSVEVFSYYFGETESIPVISQLPSSAKPTSLQAPSSNNVVKVSTDTMTVFIDKKGGRVLKAALSGYDIEGDDYAFFDRDETGMLETQAGISGDEGLSFSTSKNQYVLKGDSLKVVMQASGNKGLRYVKEFEFKRGEYVVSQTTRVVNGGNEAQDVSSYYVFSGDKQIEVDGAPPKASDLSFDNLSPELAKAVRGYSGISYTTKKKPYVRMKFNNMQKAPSETTKGGWIAYQKHHFLAAWLLEEKAYRINNYFSEGVKNEESETYEQRFVSQAVSGKSTVLPGEGFSETASLYVGPQKLETIVSVEPSLRLTLDYGFFWMFASLLHKGLAWVHKIVPSWSWSLVVLVALSRLVFFSATKRQMEEAGKLKAAAAEKAEIEKRFADRGRFDQEKHEALYSLYKRHNIKVFSLSQFVPLLQLPLMMAFYGMVAVAVEFRSESFLWLSDISLPDTLYVLPFLAVVLMYLQSTSMAASDEMKMVSKYMPVIFAFFIIKAPAALQLYLAVSTGLGALQMTLQKQKA